MRVLVIEPDRVLGQLYAKALMARGHKVDVANTAQTAVSAADEHVPDVVVLEVMMPRHSGIEFLYEFKSYPEWQDVPVIIQTVITPKKLTRASVLSDELDVIAVLNKAETSLDELCDVVERVDA